MYRIYARKKHGRKWQGFTRHRIDGAFTLAAELLEGGYHEVAVKKG